MQLDRFQIKNFRRLEDIKITLCDKETVFVGSNNSGKTSVSVALQSFIKQKKFKIYDFSAPLLKQIDKYGKQNTDTRELPSIDLYLWFSVSPDTEYGRVADLLISLDKEHTEVGLKISYSVNDHSKLLKDFNSNNSNNHIKKKLSDFLAKSGHIKEYFSFKYFKLEKIITNTNQEEVKEHPIEKTDGERAMKSLISIDIVDAQRNIDDNETARSTKLSSILADYYKSNLDKPENDAETISIIDKNNEDISEHYKQQFKKLIDSIGDLGFPSINDRGIEILSELNYETILRGNTSLLYSDTESGHQLPEAYNGLGFKNLIYIVIQISHFQMKRILTKEPESLCHIIFIEEPEVHLHPQVQQVFIRQIQKVTKKIACEVGQERAGLKPPQLLISTHSSHIIDEGNFTAIRYFQRCKSKYENIERSTATNVLNLADFEPRVENKNNLDFLKRYLRLTHCDLFFSDGAILVEGSVEKLLLPDFIKNDHTKLHAAYLTILEVGGSHANKLLPLVKFLKLPTLIISDLDSVSPNGKRPKCRADKEGSISSNKTITDLMQKKKISDLLEMSEGDSYNHNSTEKHHIVFQSPVEVSSCYGGKKFMIPRTFEEAFIYENIDLFINGKIEFPSQLNLKKIYKEDYENIYTAVNCKSYKKAEFALNLIDNQQNFNVPKYINNGLKWLEKTLGFNKEKRFQ